MQPYDNKENSVPTGMLDPNHFGPPAVRPGGGLPPLAPLPGGNTAPFSQPPPSASKLAPTFDHLPPTDTYNARVSSSYLPPQPLAGPSGRAATLYQIPENSAATYTTTTTQHVPTYGVHPGLQQRMGGNPDPNLLLSTNTVSPPEPEVIYVNRSMKLRIFVVYFVLLIEILFEAFAGTHLGGTMEKIERRVALAVTSGIQMGIHLILLIAFVAAFKDMLYVRLAMYDLFLAEFKWFFASWVMSTICVGIVRGYRIYNTVGDAFTDVWKEWEKPGLYAVYIIQRIFQLLYFVATSVALQTGMQQRFYTRECLDKIWSKFN